MSRKEFDTERYCRLNGKQPNARERWMAFYRLWRLAHGLGPHHDIAAGECFRVLMPNWEPMKMLEDGVPSLSRVHVPTFLRRQLLAHDKRKRLGYPDTEKMQAVARSVREQFGMEVTPDEVAEVRAKIIRAAREAGMTMGVPIPESDDAVLEMLRACKS